MKPLQDGILLFVVVGIGALIILCRDLLQIYGFFKSIKDREKLDKTGDPWNGQNTGMVNLLSPSYL